MDYSYIPSRFYILLISVLLLLLAPPVLSGNDALDRDLWKDGLMELEKGNYEKAVEIWAESLTLHSEPDYRIGHYMIKTVTAHNLRDYYEKASDLYYRGLSSGSVSDEDKKLLHKDLEFMRPLLGRREGNRLERLIENGNPEIYQKLAEFWNDMKVTISSEYNERLLEHWERIAYAVVNFATTSRSEYDDRGQIYIKYGAPARTRSGMLTHDPGFANYILATRMDDTVDGYGDSSNSTIFLNTLYQVRDYHNHASFEVWVYTNLTDHFNDIPFIFGNDSGGRVMQLKHSVDDFIPTGAYSTGGRNEFYSHGMTMNSDDSGSGSTDVAAEMSGGVSAGQDNIPPAVVLQIMYYRQLATIDTYFSSRYDEMLNRYESTINRLSSSIAREFQQLNISQLQRTQRNAPDNMSSYLNTLHNIEADIYTYRFLDENLEPYLRIYHTAEVDEAITIEELRRTNNLESVQPENYKLVHNVSIYDDNGLQLYSEMENFSVVPSAMNPLEENLIKIPHLDNSYSITANFELHDIADPNGHIIAENSTFKQFIKGVGEADVDVPEYLEKRGFTLSDIIMGYSDGLNSDYTDGFILSHDRIIPQNTSLNFYYEVYGLPRNSDGLYEFSLTYSIKKNRSRLGRLLRFWSSDETSISIENTHDKPVFSQQLEIISEVLEKGDYVLSLTFMNSDDEVLHQRSIEFIIE